VEPDPNDEPSSGSAGGADTSGAEPLAPGPVPLEGAQDPQQDATDPAVIPSVSPTPAVGSFGADRSAPLVGFGEPPVVAVLVTRDPGDWFESTLESLRDQDYGNLSVLVIDNGGEEDPTPRIAEVLPTAFVKRLGEDAGFSRAANEALTSVEGAAFLLVLHDDVRLEPDVVRVLVSEAFRANAGVVGPKLVRWDDRSVLDSVGVSVDAYGFASPIADADELDQSQHDTAREVFAVSDACMLIRADLFAVLGGFAEDIPFFGEDVDLCWRAHVAAAAVHFTPAAVVGHRSSFGQRRHAEDRRRLELRHQARMMFANYEPFRVLRMLPAVVVLSFIDLVGSLLLGRFGRAGDIVVSWMWNLARAPSLLRIRSRVKRIRRAHDVEYLPLTRQGSSRLLSLVRGEEEGGRLQNAAVAGRGYLREFTYGPNRFGAALASVAGLLVLVGARDLLAGPLPVVREFFDPGDDAGRLLGEWWSGWRDVGLGEPAVPPAVVPGLGLFGTLLLGSLGLARRILLLGPVLLGALGAWKLFLLSGSTRARAAALVVYGLNPLVLNAVAEGRLAVLVSYGAAPWVLRRAARAGGADPFIPTGEEPDHFWRRVAGTALILFVVAAVTPLGAAILGLTVALLALAPAMASRSSGRRMASHALAATALAAVANAPWLVRSALRGDLASVTGLWQGRGASPSAAQIITGELGPVTVGALGWGVVVAAGYALAAGRGWRFAWSSCAWLVTVMSWVAAILLFRSGLFAGSGAELVLVPAVLGLSVSAAMGGFAFDHDVVGSDFGARQLLSAVALAGLLIGLVPIAVASTNGRWYSPEGDFRRLLRVVDEGDDYRALWIGDPDLLPAAGWLVDGIDVSVALSNGLDPTVSQRYRLDGGAGVELLTEAVGAALRGGTTRLGRVLAPMGVRYVIAVDGPAPQPFAPSETPLPAEALAGLREQLDLEEVQINPGLALFRVSDPWPLRHTSPAGGDPDPERLEDQLQQPLSTPRAVLQAGAGPGTRFSGRLPAEGAVGQALNSDPGWVLSVDGSAPAQEPLRGWAQRYEPAGPGPAELSWSTPLASRALQAAQILALVLLVALASHRRRSAAHVPKRRRHSAGAPLVVLHEQEEER
jgi:GT2 family glycosyltransferase